MKNAPQHAAALRSRSAPGIAPVPPAELQALFASAPAAAWALLAAMTEAELVSQAIDQAAWLEESGKVVAWAAILEYWQSGLQKRGRGE